MPWYFFFKVLISSILITGISEIAKRSTFFGALIASLPLTSLLAIIWLYYDTRDKLKIINLSYGIFWLVIPSLTFFLSLPLMLKCGVKFWGALPVASFVTMVVYLAFMYFLKRFGVNI